jgi:hypothetical protein
MQKECQILSGIVGIEHESVLKMLEVLCRVLKSQLTNKELVLRRPNFEAASWPNHGR